jgi:anti-sigma B factor antagonist
MALTATVRTLEDVSIVDLNGKLTLGENTAYLREEVRSLVSQGTKNIILNLASVTYVDSAGLGELVGLYTTAANRGSHLKLLNLQHRIRNLMEITKLYTVFPVFEDEREALSSFDAASKRH